MNCNEFNEKISLYIDNQLNDMQKKEFEQHLNSCDKCKNDYNQMVQILEFARDCEQEELPSNYKATLREKLEECQRSNVKKKRINWKKYSAIAAGLLVIVTSVSLLSSSDMKQYDEAENKSSYEYDSMGSNTNQVADEAPKSIAPNTKKFEISPNSVATNDTIQEKNGLEKRKIIENANLSLEVDNFDKTTSDIIIYVEKSGGFIESSNEQIRTTSRGKSKYGDMVIRIPSDQFRDTLTYIKTLGQINGSESATNDITGSYMDVDSEVKNLKIQEERLREVLKKAEKVEDILKIEDELKRIRTEINQKIGRLKNWDDLVDLSTIYINIEQRKYSDEYIKPKNDNVWSKAKRGFVQNINKIIVALQNIIIAVISNLPTIIVITILILIIYLIYKKFKK